jgi:hypothetical protein
MAKFFGGQMVATGTPWYMYVLYALGAAFVIYVLIKAFTPCPAMPIKEKMSNCGCPKNSGAKSWIPLI